MPTITRQVVPGKNVPTGSLMTPGGDRGLPGPTQLSSDEGNIAQFGSDGKLYVPGSYTGRYYGTDTTNSIDYAITVDSDFDLVFGISVCFMPAMGSTGRPTLNVNGTGAKPIVTRSGYQLFSGDIIANKIIDVAYDGTNWRVLNFLARSFDALNPGNVTIECGGYDAICVGIRNSNGGGTGIILAHVAPGSPIFFTISNNFTSPIFWYLSATSPENTAVQAWFCPNTAVAGVTSINISSPAVQLTNGLRFTGSGAYYLVPGASLVILK